MEKELKDGLDRMFISGLRAIQQRGVNGGVEDFTLEEAAKIYFARSFKDYMNRASIECRLCGGTLKVDGPESLL